MEALARVILALLALVLLLQLIQRGPGGAAAWLRAKFLGQVAGR
jgi:hypothetical protein